MIQDPSESSFGLSPNIAAGIAAFFGWLGGLIILLGKPPQPWVRFVAVQAIVMSVAYIVIWIAISVVNGMLSIAHLWPLIPIMGLVGLAIGIAYFVAWLITVINAFQGKAFRVPIVAQWADRWVPASTTL